MTLSHDLRELLAANVAIELGLVQPAQAAEALRAYCEAHDRGAFSMIDALERIAGLEGDARKRLLAEVSRRLSADDTRAPLRDVTPERYVDFQAVGEGGMGIVYLALDTELNRQVAFKVVRPMPADSGDDDSATTPMKLTPPGTDSPESETFENLKKRFLQEAWITGGMEHPGVTPVYELGTTKSGIPYYTMRYIRGKRTLANAFEAAGNLDDRLALLEPFLKICDTIRYAHARGVIHRDLKPRNIALGEFGEAVVLDWGLSKVHGQPDVSEGAWQGRIREYRTTTDLKTIIGAFGTPGYMAPETLAGQSADVDAQSDVYSLGSMFYECLTGRLPFDFENFAEYANKCLKEDPVPAHERDPAVPEELSDVCTRALARDKADRFASVDEFAEALRRWRDEGALEREQAALFKKAGAAAELADELTGPARIRQADRASVMLTKLLAQRPEHREALALQGKTKELHERGVGEQQSAGRRRIAIRLGLFAIPILVIAVQILLVYVERREKERERERARTADRRAQTERIDGLRSDLRRAEGEIHELRSRKSEALAQLSTRCLKERRVGAARVAAARARLFGGSGLFELAAAEQHAAWLQTIVATQVEPSAIALSHDGVRLFWVAPGERTVRVLDMRTGKTIRRLDDEHADAVTRLHATPDGRLLTGSENGVIDIWDPGEGKLIRSYSAG
ncbi:MAG: WD40 repeat domain-containing serine/threonine protein kinase, partial [Planctomycetota bacterium]|nr:WD40 repeat domain-containing serine/threonine protein kinase [Planctomycetota bacterium]